MQSLSSLSNIAFRTLSIISEAVFISIESVANSNCTQIVSANGTVTSKYETFSSDDKSLYPFYFRRALKLEMGREAVSAITVLHLSTCS